MIQKKKQELKQVAFRPTEKLRKQFQKKVNKLKAVDGYTTQDKILIQLTDMWVSGRINLAWEGK